MATAQRPEDAILLISHHRPDVIFLDIEMPRMSGFKMLQEIDSIDFEIVFTTAYNHYAIDAIRISAFDYLVKPVVIKEFTTTVQRLLNQTQQRAKEKFEVLKKSLSDSKSQDDNIAIPTSDGVEFIKIRDIVRIESSSNYSRLILQNAPGILVTRLLKDFEGMLLPYRFYRVHNSHLINLTYIKKYIRGDGGEVVMQNGDVIVVARRKKDEFLKLIVA